MKRSVSAWLVSVLLILTVSTTGLAGANPRVPVELKFISFSDWHGQLDPISGVGGAAVLSAHFKNERAENPNTLVLTGGDDFGASPPLSSFFDEVPAVLAENLMGVDANTLGNHNFDRGLAHLQSLIDIADYPYVSANLKDSEGDLEGVVPFVLTEVAGVKVGIVGITNPDAPTLVTPGRFGQIEVTDPVPAANRARAAAQAAGAKIVVAIVHMGVAGFDALGQPFGPLIDFANDVGGFDVIFGDHTDTRYQGVHNGQLVVENLSKGITYARTRLLVDPGSGRIISRGVEFVRPLAAAVTPDADVISMLQPYRDQMRAMLDQKIGEASNIFVRGGNIERLQEVPIGNLLADALRLRYGTQIALMNGGGIRAPLPSSYAPADVTLRRNSAGYASGPPYDLVMGDVYTVLPFGNVAVTRTITGSQLLGALEHSVSSIPGANGKFLQVSGLRFTYSASAPVGARIVSASLDDGTAISAAGTYSVVLPDFVNAGGDGYSMLADGAGTTRELLAAIVFEHIIGAGTITPSTDGRITKLP